MLVALAFLTLSATLFIGFAVLHRLYDLELSMVAGLSEVLTATSDVATSFDAFVARQPAPTPAVDLQPAVDSLVALKAKIDSTNPTPSA